MWDYFPKLSKLFILPGVVPGAGQREQQDLPQNTENSVLVLKKGKGGGGGGKAVVCFLQLCYPSADGTSFRVTATSQHLSVTHSGYPQSPHFFPSTPSDEGLEPEAASHCVHPHIIIRAPEHGKTFCKPLNNFLLSWFPNICLSILLPMPHDDTVSEPKRE